MNDIVYAGFLEKESLYLKTFRKRWIVLKKNKLYTYKTKQTNSDPTEIIDLSICQNIKIINASTFTFTMVFENKQRKFNASNYDEMNQWIKYVKKAIKVQNNDDDDIKIDDNSIC